MGVVRYIWNKVDRWDRALEKFRDDRKLSKKAKDLEKSRKDLVRGVESAATQMDKKEDSKTARKLRDMAKELKEAPGKVIKELKAFLKKAKLSPETKQKLQAQTEKVEVIFKSLLNSINVKTQHNKHVEKVIIALYKEIYGIVEKDFGVCDYGQTTGIISDLAENVCVLILKAIKSVLERYARMHKPSVVNKWYKYLLENIKRISENLNEQVYSLKVKNNRGDKKELLSDLCGMQKTLCLTLLAVLDLEKYVKSNNIEKSSLGLVVNGEKYKKLFASIKRILESYMDNSICEKMGRDLLGLVSASGSNPVEVY